MTKHINIDMHPQIRQLAQEAGMYVDLNGKPWPKWMSAEECEVAYKKFAELIVRECIQAVKNVGGYNEDYHMNAIKKYFGVEE